MGTILKGLLWIAVALVSFTAGLGFLLMFIEWIGRQ